MLLNQGIENQRCGRRSMTFHDLLREGEAYCDVRQKFKKAPPRPVTSFPSAKNFNQNIAVDLKQFGKRWMIYFCDHFTRFSACAVIDNKRAETILDAFLKCLISFFGASESFLSDNGGVRNEDLHLSL